MKKIFFVAVSFFAPLFAGAHMLAGEVSAYNTDYGMMNMMGSWHGGLTHAGMILWIWFLVLCVMIWTVVGALAAVWLFQQITKKHK